MLEHNIINLEINKYVLNEDPGAFVLSIVVQDFKKRKEYKNETYSNHRSTNVKLKYRFLFNTLSKFTVGDHKCLYK